MANSNLLKARLSPLALSIIVASVFLSIYIGLPLLSGRREGDRRIATIVGNLFAIEAAKQMWVADHGLRENVQLTWHDLTPYLPKNAESNLVIKPVMEELYRINGLGVAPEARLKHQLKKWPPGTVIRQSWGERPQFILPATNSLQH